MGIMEMSEVSLPQFLHKASCSSPREIPAGMPRRYCSSNNKHGVVTRAEGEGVIPSPASISPRRGPGGAP